MRVRPKLSELRRIDIEVCSLLSIMPMLSTVFVDSCFRLSGKFQALDAAVEAGGSAMVGRHEAPAVEGGMGMLGGAVNGLFVIM